MLAGLGVATLIPNGALSAAPHRRNRLTALLPRSLCRQGPAGGALRILATAQLPAGYSAQLAGTFAAQEEAALVISTLSLVSLTLIFMVLYQRYQSAVLATIILTNIPLA